VSSVCFFPISILLSFTFLQSSCRQYLDIDGVKKIIKPSATAFNIDDGETVLRNAENMLKIKSKISVQDL
jgi:hypothetical protein